MADISKLMMLCIIFDMTNGTLYSDDEDVEMHERENVKVLKNTRKQPKTKNTKSTLRNFARNNTQSYKMRK
jgi:hypothetical protein